MLLEQQDIIVNLYKTNHSYKEICAKTGIPMGTISSFLRRKHKNLKQLKTIQRRRELAHYTSHFAKMYGISETQAQAMYENARERFDNKRRDCLSHSKPFTIQFSELVFPTHCPILGLKLDYWAENYRDDAYPSFDRTNPALGYVTGNVQIVSWRANRIKNDGSASEHRQIADYLDKLSEGA
jgi:hypothetical protein